MRVRRDGFARRVDVGPEAGEIEILALDLQMMDRALNRLRGQRHDVSEFVVGLQIVVGLHGAGATAIRPCPLHIVQRRLQPLVQRLDYFRTEIDHL